MFIWGGPIPHFGCPLFKSWLKACVFSKISHCTQLMYKMRYIPRSHDSLPQENNKKFNLIINLETGSDFFNWRVWGWRVDGRITARRWEIYYGFTSNHPLIPSNWHDCFDFCVCSHTIDPSPKWQPKIQLS